MLISSVFLVLFVFVELYVCQILECPRICICYKWQSFGRVDCVRQGILDARIGFRGDGNSEAERMTEVIEVLDLSHNSISILNDRDFNLNELKLLKAIHLSHNSIIHVSPLAFLGLENLQLIDLSHNRLRRIQNFKPQPVLLPAEIFINAPNLRVLRLGYNPLEKEDHHGKSNTRGSHLLTAPRLEFLDLGSCHLGHIDVEDFTYLGSLRMLNLSDNQLITLNPSALDSMINLSYLMLTSNPWPCDRSSDLNNLDNWLMYHGFMSICPMKKFERIKVETGKHLGPQKAEDEESLLYYYKSLGNFKEEVGWMSSNLSSFSEDLKDVEVFQELERKADGSFVKMSSYNVHSAVNDNNTNTIYHANCSVYGIPVVWFLIFAFQAGIFVSFLVTFCWMSKLYRVIIHNIMNSGTQITSRFSLRHRNPHGSVSLPSVSNNDNDRVQERESYHLLEGSTTELDGWGLTTPIIPRAAQQGRRKSNKFEGPPTYEEHVSQHPIIIV